MANTQIIEYKGVEYEFPVTMSDDQIRMHIRRDEESRQMKDFVGDDKPEKPTGMLDKALSVQGQVLDNAKNFAVGAAKGVGNTVYNLGKLAHKLPGMDVIAPDRAGAFEGGPPQALGAEGGWQTAGKAAEQVGEFFVPGAASAGKLAPVANALGSGLAGRAVTGALTGGGVTAAQGGDPIAGGLAGGVAPVAAAAVGKAAPMMMNAKIGATASSFRRGANPGQGIVDEGLVAGSLGGMEKQVLQAKETLGKQIGETLGLLPQATQTRVDVTRIIDDAIGRAQTAHRTIGGRDAVARLDAMRAGLYESFAELGTSPSAVTPRDLWIIKHILDDGINHQAKEGVEASINAVVKTIRRGFAKEISAAVPGISKLNQRYSNLAEASDDVIEKMNKSQGLQDFVRNPINWLLGGGVGYMMHEPAKAAVALAAKAALTSMPAVSGAAQVARGAGSPQGQDLASRLLAAGVSSATQPQPDELQRILSGQQ